MKNNTNEVNKRKKNDEFKNSFVDPREKGKGPVTILASLAALVGSLAFATYLGYYLFLLTVLCFCLGWLYSFAYKNIQKSAFMKIILALQSGQLFLILFYIFLDLGWDWDFVIFTPEILIIVILLIWYGNRPQVVPLVFSGTYYLLSTTNTILLYWANNLIPASTVIIILIWRVFLLCFIILGIFRLCKQTKGKNGEKAATK